MADEVTVGQFLEAQALVCDGWAGDDHRWEQLQVLLDYSIQYGRYDCAELGHLGRD